MDSKYPPNLITANPFFALMNDMNVMKNTIFIQVLNMFHNMTKLLPVDILFTLLGTKASIIHAMMTFISNIQPPKHLHLKVVIIFLPKLRGDLHRRLLFQVAMDMYTSFFL